MEEINLLIIFADGERIIVKDIEEYGYSGDRKHYYYIKNRVKNFMPREQIRFIGRHEDYTE